LFFASRNCRVELRARSTLSALNLDELSNDLPVSTIEALLHRLLLRFEAQATLALLVGRDSDEIDGDASLSSDIKYRRRCEIATQAIPDFEASKTLARARQAVELAAKHNFEQHVRDATRKALKEVEHGWQRAMDKIAERASLSKSPVMRRKILTLGLASYVSALPLKADILSTDIDVRYVP
jgi:hypothetical protein